MSTFAGTSAVMLAHECTQPCRQWPMHPAELMSVQLLYEIATSRGWVGGSPRLMRRWRAATSSSPHASTFSTKQERAQWRVQFMWQSREAFDQMYDHGPSDDKSASISPAAAWRSSKKK